MKSKYDEELDGAIEEVAAMLDGVCAVQRTCNKNWVTLRVLKPSGADDEGTWPDAKSFLFGSGAFYSVFEMLASGKLGIVCKWAAALVGASSVEEIRFRMAACGVKEAVE